VGGEIYCSKYVKSTMRNLLSEREKEIVKLISEGMSSRKIAEELSVSPRTVEAHRANIYRKLGIHTLADLIKYALKNELCSSE